MNHTIAKIGSVIVTITVFLFAVFEAINWTYGSCFVCLLLPIGFIMMTGGLHNECKPDCKVSANIGMIFSAVYCTFIMLVYFAQLTTVTNEELSEQTAKLIDFGKMGLLFNYDMLGYGMMALSTFFTGLSHSHTSSLTERFQNMKIRLMTTWHLKPKSEGYLIL